MWYKRYERPNVEDVAPIYKKAIDKMKGDDLPNG